MGGLVGGAGGGGGSLSQGIGGMGSTRSAPAEDVLEAIARLNSTLKAAVRSGWVIVLTVSESSPAFAGERPTVPTLVASLHKETAA